MSVFFDTRYACSPKEVKGMDTNSLREAFLIETLFLPGQIHLTYSHFDRYIAGGAMPTHGFLPLESIDPLKSTYFLERRELGVINIGGAGQVRVDGVVYQLGYKEAIYIGRGVQEVLFASDESAHPAKFYINSAPAHRSFPTKRVTREEAEIIELGSSQTANHRVINKLLISGVVETCQLQMGMTELKPGSIWNTMPAHVHDRRMEVYCYFEVPDDHAVCHFMGEPQESRHIWMQNEQAVISPPWSIHAGAATTNYTFIWGMAGENLDYGDMDGCAISDLR